MTKLFKSVAPMLVSIALSIPIAQAATIVSVSGPNDISTNFTSLGNNLMVGFSTTTAYTNVAVSVSLNAFFGGGDWNLAAYLTDQVGPGTTAVNEIASSSSVISIPGSPLFDPYTITPYTVFSGLTLPAGSYYLILSGTFETATVNWVGYPTAGLSVFTEPGAAVTRSFTQAGAPDPYLPASDFGDFQGAGLWFTVTGDAAIPEPSTVAMCLGGVLALAGTQLRRRRI
jgi:hypothetical protein